MSYGSMHTIYSLNGVTSCHTCSAKSLVICRGCSRGFCRDHFVMCTGCHEWFCAGCFDESATHKCGVLALDPEQLAVLIKQG